MPVVVPPGLQSRRALGPAWADWLDALPRLVDATCARWHLTPDGDPSAGHTALVLPVRDADGVRRALKAGFVEEDNAGEPTALQFWRGRGAVSLLRADPPRGVLLLEWLGGSLAVHADAEEATAVVAGLYTPLHRRAAPQLRSVHPLVRRWVDELAALGREVPAPARFVEQAVLAGRRLAAEPATHVLHGDLHDGNVLDRAGEWVAIDPKGLNGDPCYEVAPLLWNRWDDLLATGNVGAAIRERLYAVVDAAGLDERRVRDWVVVRVMVNVGWTLADARRAGRGLTDADRAWITRMVTIAKAAQAVGADT